MQKTLFIRADAGFEMGTGHMMRMLALAQAWQENGGAAVFLCAEITPSLEERIENEKFRVLKLAVVPGSRDDLEATSAMISQQADDCDDSHVTVALDGYQFDADFQIGIKRTRCQLLATDDYGHLASYHADFVLNQNISASEGMYSRRESGTRLLLGPRYALLRREFLDFRGWERTIPERAKRLLITLGGADADNVTGKVITALADLGFEAKVVVGGSNPNLPDLLRAANTTTAGTTSLQLIVNPTNMPELMTWADFAVAAGGSTSWELAFTGLPSVLIITAANQEKNARELERRGFGLCLGEHSEFDGRALRETVDRLASDRALRVRLALRGREMVDGLGAHRVAMCLLNGDLLEIYPVTARDFSVLWDWANDRVTRANSFEAEAIPWEQHETWCRAKLNDPLCRFFMATTTDIGKIGFVRFDCKNGEATISVALSPQARGKGHGKRIIKAACDQIFRSGEVHLVRALIKPSNKSSIGAFEKAGFRRGKATTVKGQPAEQYLLRKT